MPEPHKRDPRLRDGVPRATGQSLDEIHTEWPWSIEAWDGDRPDAKVTLLGGAWGASLEETIARAERYVREGDVDGHLYDHVDIVNTTYRAYAVQMTFSIEEARYSVRLASNQSG